MKVLIDMDNTFVTLELDGTLQKVNKNVFFFPHIRSESSPANTEPSHDLLIILNNILPCKWLH